MHSSEYSAREEEDISTDGLDYLVRERLDSNDNSVAPAHASEAGYVSNHRGEDTQGKTFLVATPTFVWPPSRQFGALGQIFNRYESESYRHLLRPPLFWPTAVPVPNSFPFVEDLLSMPIFQSMGIIDREAAYQYCCLEVEREGERWRFQPVFICGLLLMSNIEKYCSELRVTLLAELELGMEKSGPVALFESLGEALSLNKDYRRAAVLAGIYCQHAGFAPLEVYCEYAIGRWLYGGTLFEEAIPFLWSTFSSCLDKLDSPVLLEDVAYDTVEMLQESIEKSDSQERWWNFIQPTSTQQSYPESISIHDKIVKGVKLGELYSRNQAFDTAQCMFNFIQHRVLEAFPDIMSSVEKASILFTIADHSRCEICFDNTAHTLIKAIELLVLEARSPRCEHCMNQIHQFIYCISKVIEQEEAVTNAQKSSAFDVIIKQLMPCVLDDSWGQDLLQHLPTCKDSSYRGGVKFREDVINHTVRGLLGLEPMTSEGSFFLTVARRGLSFELEYAYQSSN